MLSDNGFLDGFIVPVFQAGTTGILSGLTVGSIAALAGVGHPLEWSLATGSACALAGWLSYRGHWQWRLEKQLENAGAIVEPLPAAEPARSDTLRVELIQDQGRSMDFIDLPCPEKLPALASGILAGRQFSQSVWTGQGALFSRSEFESLRQALIERRLATWRNPDAPAQGVILTAAGRAIFRRLAARPPLSEREQ